MLGLGVKRSIVRRQLHRRLSAIHKIQKVFGRRSKLLLSAAGVAAVAAAIVFGVLGAIPLGAQSFQGAPQGAQGQTTTTAAPVYEYDVVSIKPSRPDTGAGIMVGMRDTPDGFTATNVPLLFLVQSAYGVNGSQISGAPSWLRSDKYDVEAKMDASVVAALEKLAPEERKLARRKMLQAVLADRAKLVVHRDTKEQLVYSLVIAKNGPKLQESKPVATPENGALGSGGSARSGMGMSAGSEDGKSTASFHEATITYLVGWLSVNLRSPVTDKTGLTGNYDFKLKYVRDQNRMQPPPGAPPDGQIPVASLDDSGPTLLDAIQEQIGLKLEAGKGSVEGIVIDHVERPSGN
jgi:uncharacterized protein (TIGR03435 family)